jgi:hypothetical protein
MSKRNRGGLVAKGPASARIGTYTIGMTAIQQPVTHAPCPDNPRYGRKAENRTRKAGAGRPSLQPPSTVSFASNVSGQSSEPQGFGSRLSPYPAPYCWPSKRTRGLVIRARFERPGPTEFPGQGK